MRVRIGVVLVVGVLLLSVMCARRFLMIDSCLDHGGRWDYALNRCER